MDNDTLKELFGRDLQQTGLPQTVPPSVGFVPVNPSTGQEGTTWVHDNLPYLNTFLSSQVGKDVNVGYIFGTGQTVDRRGKLVGVGYNYIILLEESTQNYLACDFYSIKFVRILN